MSVVDAHVHILPPGIRERVLRCAGGEQWFTECHPEGRAIVGERELLEEMDAAGVDRAVCFTWPFVDPLLCAEANDWLAGVIARQPDRLVGFGIVNPATPHAAAEALRCARLGLRGIGELNADAQGWSLAPGAATVDALAEACLAADLPWNLHCSEPVGHRYPGKGTAHPGLIEGIAERHPELRLVLAHLGGGLPFYAHMPEVAQLCRRLWFDTAALPFLYAPTAIRTVVELCGSDRVLFGSDHPLLGMRRCLDGVAAAGLADADQRAVLGGAASSLLGD